MSEGPAPYITKTELNIIKSVQIGELYLFKIEYRLGWLAVMHDRAEWITEDLTRPGLAALMTSDEYFLILPLMRSIMGGIQSHLSGKFDQYTFDVYRASDGPAVVVINSEHHVQCLRIMAAYIYKNFLEGHRIGESTDPPMEEVDWYIHYPKEGVYDKIQFQGDFYNCTLKRVGRGPNVG